MTEKTYTLNYQTLVPLFLGKNEENIAVFKHYFITELIPRGSDIKLMGSAEEVGVITNILSDLEQTLKNNKALTVKDVHATIQIYKTAPLADEHIERPINSIESDYSIHTISKVVKPKSAIQEKLVRSIFKNDLVFSIGPAGTGKTYLAVAAAVHYLKSGLVNKIVLTRPAVEAGESLGFLPGDFKEKIDPYLKPLYDALAEMIPKEMLKKYFDFETIEVLPLAYMRGRTLNSAFVILDEAQNTTFTQMKMFLTRLGKNSKAVVTGDITQIDLDQPKKSGLISSINILKDVNNIDFVQLSEEDVVRHTLVREIINAYDRFAEQEEEQE